MALRYAQATHPQVETTLMGGISIWQLLIVLLVVILVFGTKKLPSLGQDLGNALRGFKKAMTEDDKPKLEADPAAQQKADQVTQKDRVQ